MSSHHGAGAGGALPAAITLLAVSIFALAAVLAGMEWSRERRARKYSRHQQNEAVLDAASTRTADDDSIPTLAELARPPTATVAADANERGTKTDDGAVGSATLITAGNDRSSTTRRRHFRTSRLKGEGRDAVGARAAAPTHLAGVVDEDPHLLDARSKVSTMIQGHQQQSPGSAADANATVNTVNSYRERERMSRYNLRQCLSRQSRSGSPRTTPLSQQNGNMNIGVGATPRAHPPALTLPPAAHRRVAEAKNTTIEVSTAVVPDPRQLRQMSSSGLGRKSGSGGMWHQVPDVILSPDLSPLTNASANPIATPVAAAVNRGTRNETASGAHSSAFIGPRQSSATKDNIDGLSPALAPPPNSNCRAQPPVPGGSICLSSGKDCRCRRLEILVHNVSHKDMVLSLRRTRHAVAATRKKAGAGLDAPDSALGRPKFSLFKASSELILDKLMEIRAEGRSDPPPALCTAYRRGETVADGNSTGDGSQRCDDGGSCGHGDGSGRARVERDSEENDETKGNGDIGNHSRSSSSFSSVREVDEQQQQQQQQNISSNNDIMREDPCRRRQRALPQRLLAVGFDLDAEPIPVSDLTGYRVRSGDLDRLFPLGMGCPSSQAGTRLRRHDTWGLPMDSNTSKRDSPEGVSTGNDGGDGAAYSGAKLREAREEGIGVEGLASAADTEEVVTGEAFITGVYFPLLSVLMPKWLEQLTGNGDGDSAKTILLVSGVGQPRNQKHRVEDNSTEITAVLMEDFIKRHYPDVRVVRVHSNTNIFRYDDNIRFVKTELLPLLNAERSKMAEEYGADWKEMMHITISFADGSPARISSINSALRHFRPSFIHIWELKTLWHEKKICEDDVEVHSFEDIDMLPPMPAAEVDAPTAMVISEMLRLKGDLERVLSAPLGGDVVGGNARDDLASFWLRKTKRPVLAVLLVQKAGGQPQLYRGTNMEVSMPTGSLCAERNVIGSALAADLTLLRRDIKAVAVLAMTSLGRQRADNPRQNTTAPSSSSIASSTVTTPVLTAVNGPHQHYTQMDCSGSDGKPVSDSGSGGSGRLGDVNSGCASSSAVGSFAFPALLHGTPASRVWPSRGLRRGKGGGRVGVDYSDELGFHDEVGVGEGEVDGEGDSDGGRTEEENRLEDVRQALFAVAAVFAKDSTTSRSPNSSEDRSPQQGQRHEHENANPQGQQPQVEGGGVQARSDKKRDEKLGESEQHSNQVRQPGDDSGNGVGNCRQNPRVRSQSCADEIFAAAQRCDSAAVADGSAGRAGEGGRGREAALRSQSFDHGARGCGQKAADSEVESWKKGLRGSKLLRSIFATRLDGFGGPHHGRGDEGQRVSLGGWGVGGPGGGWGFEQDRGGGLKRVPAELDCVNPLKPCGACMEWLKKIAEVNPDFKVITFTDSGCQGVYIEDVAQIV